MFGGESSEIHGTRKTKLQFHSFFCGREQRGKTQAYREILALRELWGLHTDGWNPVSYSNLGLRLPMISYRIRILIFVFILWILVTMAIRLLEKKRINKEILRIRKKMLNHRRKEPGLTRSLNGLRLIPA